MDFGLCFTGKKKALENNSGARILYSSFPHCIDLGRQSNLCTSESYLVSEAG